MHDCVNVTYYSQRMFLSYPSVSTNIYSSILAFNYYIEISLIRLRYNSIFPIFSNCFSNLETASRDE